VYQGCAAQEGRPLCPEDGPLGGTAPHGREPKNNLNILNKLPSPFPRSLVNLFRLFSKWGRTQEAGSGSGLPAAALSLRASLTNPNARLTL